MNPIIEKIKVVHCSISDHLIKAFNGTFSVKGGRLWLQEHANVLGLVVDRRTPSLIRTLRYYLLTTKKLVKSNGLPWVVKYLKACTVLLMQSTGGHKIKDPRKLGLAVSRTGNGLPRIIPSIWRERIRRGDKKAIRVWLTLFSVYRIISIPGKIKLSTITDPGVCLDKSLSLIKSLVKIFWELRPYRGPTLAEMTVELFPIFRSGSSSSLRGETQVSTSVYSILRSAKAILNSPILESFQALCTEMKSDLHSKLIPWSKGGTVFDPSPLGRLGFKLEAAGKVRVFAMVDPWTNWLLKPLHLGIFHHLRSMVTDGTFDQLKPIKRLIEKGHRSFWCYDLSAATDRLPVNVQVELLRYLFGDVADHWRKLLVGRSYHYPSDSSVGCDKPGEVLYSVGQPMGALSSWAMLALTHHFIIQWAAWKSKAFSGKILFPFWFVDYAVLGDDVVIANGRVAREYIRIMKMLGVEIGLAKSLVSRKGALEFAKRFFVSGQDCSPVPYKEYVAARASMGASLELMRKYSLSFCGLLRARGYGFRAMSFMSKPVFKLAPKIRNLFLLAEKSRLGVVDWLAIGVNRLPNWILCFERFSNWRIKSLDDRLNTTVDALYSAQHKTEADGRIRSFEGLSGFFVDRVGERLRRERAKANPGKWFPKAFDNNPGVFEGTTTTNWLDGQVVDGIINGLWDPRFSACALELRDIYFRICRARNACNWISRESNPREEFEKLQLVLDDIESRLDLAVVPDLTQSKKIEVVKTRSSLKWVKAWLFAIEGLRSEKKTESSSSEQESSIVKE